MSDRLRSRLSVEALGHQRYDPELAVIDPGAMEVSRERLRLGYGAPSVVPYGQRLGRRLMGTNRRRMLLQAFPALNNFPMIKRVLEQERRPVY